MASSSPIFYHEVNHETGQPKGGPICNDDWLIAYDNPVDKPEEDPCRQGTHRPQGYVPGFLQPVHSDDLGDT